MVFDVSKISGIDKYTTKKEQNRELYLKENKVFLVVNQNTIEVRSDQKLANLLKEKYESVMESRYFGKGGIEIVVTDQFSNSELEDLVRLSYALTE